MENCEIEIATSTGAKTELFRTQGQFGREGEGYRVCYTQEGDPVSLEFDSVAFKMKRCGRTELSCVFLENERTAMQLSGFGGTGEIPVQTTAYMLRSAASGCSVILNYDLIFSENLQTFRLKLKIETSEEK